MAVEVFEVIAALLTIVSILALWFWSNKQFRLMKKQLQIQNEQTKLMIFADYTKRYQEIILHFPENINDLNFSLEDLKKDDKRKYDETMRYMRVYFDMCSEEYFLFRDKKIPQKVWNEWESGMKYAFNKTAFRDAWSIINKDSGFYPDFAKFVKSFIKHSGE